MLLASRAAPVVHMQLTERPKLCPPSLRCLNSSAGEHGEIPAGHFMPLLPTAALQAPHLTVFLGTEAWLCCLRSVPEGPLGSDFVAKVWMAVGAHADLPWVFSAFHRETRIRAARSRWA